MGRKFKDIKYEVNNEFDNLLNDHQHGRLDSHISLAAVRPAYAYTKQCHDKHWKEGIIPKNYKARLKT